jgi:ECF transporter S component (folate family)
MPKVKQLALAGLLLAVLILFERFISIETQLLRVGFAYVPYILAGWLLGPLWTGVIGVAGDLLGMLLMPKAGFFAGFTLNALLTGLVYGLFLHNRPVGKALIVRFVISLVIVHAVIHLGLTTLWLSIMYKKAFFVIIVGRIIANLIELPVELVSMLLIMRFLEKPAKTYLNFGDRDSVNEDDGEDGGVAGVV